MYLVVEVLSIGNESRAILLLEPLANHVEVLVRVRLILHVVDELGHPFDQLCNRGIDMLLQKPRICLVSLDNDKTAGV